MRETMTFKTVVALAAAALCGGTAQVLIARMRSQPFVPDVSVVAPDEYRIEFENEFVRVARVKPPAHVTVPMHSHAAPGGMIVTLTDQDSRVTGRDGTRREIHAKAGQARWAVSTPGADLSTQSAHTEENPSDKPIELLRIDPKPFSPRTAALAGGQAAFGTPADEAAIRKILDARNVAYNSHNAKALAAAYAADADLVTGTGRLVSGRAEIEKNYVDAFAGVDKNATVRIDSSKIRFVTPDTAILDMEGVTTGRTDGAVRTHATWIYVKRNGEWMVVAIRATRIQ
jgi:uncharacterized protein (TIGR02246 family)